MDVKNKFRQKLKSMRLKRQGVDSFLSYLDKNKVPDDLIEPILNFKRLVTKSKRIKRNHPKFRMYIGSINLYILFLVRYHTLSSLSLA